MHLHTRSRLALSLACIAIATGGALAQPGGRPSQQGQTDRANPEQFRERLAKVLDLAEARATQLRSAIETLDAGGTTSEAIEILGGPERARMLASWLWDGGDRPRDGRPGDRAEPRTDQPSPEEVMDFLREHAPEIATRVRAYSGDSSRMLGRLTSRLAPKIVEIRAAQAHDPELAEIMQEELRVSLEVMDITRRLFAARRQQDNSALEAAQADLGVAAERIVELRFRKREHEVLSLLNRAERLKAELETQKESREDLVREVVEGASRAVNRQDRAPDRDRRGPRRDNDADPRRGGG